MNEQSSVNDYKEWIIKVRLAHFKRLSISKLDNNQKELLLRLKELLLEDGINEEELRNQTLVYGQLNDEEKIKILEDKVLELVMKLLPILETNDEVSSKDYPEFYHAIQELIAYSPDEANKLIKEIFAKEHINHCMSCGSSLYGNPCTYYFSKKLTYK